MLNSFYISVSNTSGYITAINIDYILGGYIIINESNLNEPRVHVFQDFASIALSITSHYKHLNTITAH